MCLRGVGRGGAQVKAEPPGAALPRAPERGGTGFVAGNDADGRGCSLVFRFSGAGVNMGPCGLKSGHP